MDLGNVMDDLGAAVDTISGLRVFPYWADRVEPPAAIVGFPEEFEFDSTARRGSDRGQFPLIVVVGKADARSARDTLSVYCGGAGATSVKAVVEAYAATAYDSARVQSVEFGVISIGGVEYLAATFSIDVIGRGA